MTKKRRRKNTTMSLSIYHDERACRAWIAWLEQQIKRAYRTLSKIMLSKLSDQRRR